MEGEVRTYESVTHPNLLRILDKNLPEDWFVTEYHPLGPLTKHLGRCAGDPLAALRAFRPLVEATAVLHEQRMIHRDIKPANIFVTVDGSLVLGDAGIVFFSDDERSRVSDTLENVGSRDWMPQWAMGMRLEDVKPTFDVFCLGKVLWAMVSGRPLLRLWYHRRPEFDLEKFFPGDDRMPWINALLAQCVVEHEEDMTISSAGALLKVVDEILVALGRDGRLLRKAGPGHCGMCGVGLYGLLVDRARLDSAISNMGLNPGAGTWRIFRCNRCGHLQFFLEHSTLIGINKADVWGT
jgi:serine/threonine protein kinase